MSCFFSRAVGIRVENKDGAGYCSVRLARKPFTLSGVPESGGPVSQSLLFSSRSSAEPRRFRPFAAHRGGSLLPRPNHQRLSRTAHDSAWQSHLFVTFRWEVSCPPPAAS